MCIRDRLNRMLMSGDYGNPRSDQYTLLNSFLVNRIKFGGIQMCIRDREIMLIE